jgi:hypothetical protein
MATPERILHLECREGEQHDINQAIRSVMGMPPHKNHIRV